MRNQPIRTLFRAKSAGRALAVGAIAVALVGCASTTNGQAEGQPAAGPAEQPVTAPATGTPETPTADNDECSVATPCEISFRWWGGDTRRELQMEAIEVFMAQNPDIIINPMPVSWDGYYTALAVELAAGNTPDVYTVHSSWPLELGLTGRVLDLRTVPTIDLQDYPEAILAASTGVGGQLWGMPIGGNALSLAANPAVFAQAGVELPDDTTWTWDDFVEIAAQISANTPDGTFGAQIGGAPVIRAWGNQTDGGLFTADGQINVSQDSLAQWFALHAELDNVGATAPAAAQAEGQALSLEESGMAQGTTGMQAIWNQQMPALARALGDDLVILRLPGDATSPHIGSFVNPGMYFVISANTRYPEAAGRFVDFMVNSTEAVSIMGTDRGVPLNPRMAEFLKPDLPELEQEVINFLDRIAENGGPAVPEPVGAGLVYDNATRLMFEVMFGRMTPEVAAATWLSDTQESMDHAANQ